MDAHVETQGPEHLFPHHSGEQVSKLLDHPYQVFFPDFNLLQEIAVNMAQRFNELGVTTDVLDFDGFEGMSPLGKDKGDYGLEVFAKTFYDHLDHTVINGPSIQGLLQHICTYCNWGEPWYGVHTEHAAVPGSTTGGSSRQRCLPHMLGWYLLTNSTTANESRMDAGAATATWGRHGDQPGGPEEQPGCREVAGCHPRLGILPKGGGVSARTSRAAERPGE
ncbi:MAG: hypothetical protein MZV63_55360 [Marinilabiliales bacterium]|nr:hypothetical protein [Marinilabiliales bacterium]